MKLSKLRESGDAPPTWRLASLVAVPLLVWWLAFWPGLATPDSFVVWDQVRNGGWTQSHSVLYTALAWWSWRLSGTPALLTLAQVAMVAGSIAMLVRALDGRGLPWRITTLAAVVLAASPILGLFTQMIWKDVPFTATLVALAALLVRAVGAITSRRLVAIAVLAAIATLFRNNGVVVVSVLGLLVVVVGVPGRAKLVASLGAGAVSALVVVVALYPGLGISLPPAWVASAGFFSDVALLGARSSFSAEEERVVARVGDPAAVAAAARCDTVDPAIEQVRDFDALERESPQFVALWRGRLRSDPLDVAGIRACRAAVGWNPIGWPWPSTVPVPSTKYPPAWVLDPDQETIADLEVRGVPFLRSAGYRAAKLSGAPLVAGTVWRGALWTIVATAAVVLSARARSVHLLTAVLVCWSLQIGVALTAPAQDARYVMGSVVIGVLVTAGVLGVSREGVRCASGS